MTARIREFLKRRTDEGPCLVVDLDVVRDNSMPSPSAPDSKVYYAIKANPAPEILKLLVEIGASFDVASLGETEEVLAAGATADRISYGNPIKKESDIAAAFKLGVTLFAIDCEAEAKKVARAAPGSPGDLPHPLRQRRGRLAAVAQVRLRAGLCRRHPGIRPPAGLVAHGISFHVGSQQNNVEAWDRALASTAAIFRTCAERGINLSMVNLGGGFPAKYIRKTPKLNPTARRSSARCASTSATPSRTPSSSPAAAWSATPA